MSVLIRKCITSVLLGPLFLVPAMPILACALALFNLSPIDMDGMISLYSMYGLFGLAYAYPAAAVYGLPTILGLRYFGILNLPFVLLIALIPTAIVFGVIASSAAGFLLFGYASLAVAFGCWAVFTWL